VLTSAALARSRRRELAASGLRMENTRAFVLSGRPKHHLDEAGVTFVRYQLRAGCT
jgi:hypothetical protein